MNIERTRQIMPHADLALNNVRTALSSCSSSRRCTPRSGRRWRRSRRRSGSFTTSGASGSRRPRPQAAVPPVPSDCIPAARPGLRAAARACVPAARACVPAARACVPAARSGSRVRRRSRRRPGGAPAGRTAQQRAYENAATVAAAGGQVPYQAAPAPAAGRSGRRSRAHQRRARDAERDELLQGALRKRHHRSRRALRLDVHGPEDRLERAAQGLAPGGLRVRGERRRRVEPRGVGRGATTPRPASARSSRRSRQEARQLIYRYVRNREPLFHDDL